MDDSRTSGQGIVGLGNESEESEFYSEFYSSDSETDPIEAAFIKKQQDADATIRKQKLLINRLSVRMSRQKKNTSKLEAEIAGLKSRLNYFGDDFLNELKEIKEGATQNDPFSSFMMDQVIINFKNAS